MTQPVTKQLPAVSLPLDTARELVAEMKATRADVAILREDQQVANQQMALMQQDISQIKQRQDDGSLRVRAESRTNMQQDAALATVIMEQGEARKRDEATQALIAANTTITAEGVKLAKSAAKHPAVQALFLALIVFLTSWLTRHT